MISRLWWMIRAKRIGPDIFATHLLMHSRRLSRAVCKAKFGSFGEKSWVRPGVYADCTDNIFIGNRVVLRPGTKLLASPEPEGKIIIEDDALLGPDVLIICDNHAFGDIDKPISEQGYRPAKPVVIKSGAWLGARVTVLPGVTIGKNAVVGACYVVTKNIDDYSIAVGNPAKVIKNIS